MKETVISILPEAWEWADSERTAGQAEICLEIEGLPLHITALQVREGPFGLGLLEAMNPEYQHWLAGLDMIDPGRFQTTTILGQRYVIFATPYQE
jgi:hypothetical protein